MAIILRRPAAAGISTVLLRGILASRGWEQGIGVVASIGGGWYRFRQP